MPKETVIIKKFPSYYFAARGLNEKGYLCARSDFTLAGLSMTSNSLVWKRGRNAVNIIRAQFHTKAQFVEIVVEQNKDQV